MSKTKWISIVVLLILAAVGGSYLYLRFLAGKRLTVKTGAELVPEDAEMMAFVSSDSNDWSQLQAYGTPELRDILQSKWEQQKSKLFEQESADSGINYQEDIAPWLGNVAIASFSTFDEDTDEDTKQQNQSENFLAIAGIKNPIKAWQFRNSLDQNQTTIKSTKDYEGVTITTFETQNGELYRSARVNGYLLVSSKQTVIENTIDTAKKGESSFASQMDLQELNLNNPVASFYLSDKALKVPEQAQTQGTPENLEKQLDQIPIQSMAMGIDLKQEGVHLQTRAQVNSKQEFLSFEPSPNKLLRRLPDDTIALINGNDLNAIWSQIKARSEENESLKQGIESLEETVPIDLDEEGFGWMDGEYAIAVFPTEKALFPGVAIGGAIFIESTQRERGEELLTTLGEMSQGMGEVTSRETTINNTDVTVWELQQLPQPVVSHGWLENDLLLLTIASPFNSMTEINQESSLQVSDKFSAIEQVFPNENFGYFYFDMKQAMTQLENSPQNPLKNTPPEAKAIMESIRQVGVTTSQPDTNTPQMDVFISLESRGTQ